jgi:hypothetical protein
LFDRLKTLNFETVVRALEDAAKVEAAYGHEEQVIRLLNDAEVVRRALITAIQAAHPTHLENIKDVIPSWLKFLSSFSRVFTTNYDLLLYWVIINSRRFGDGFRLAWDENGFRGPFQEDMRCNVFNVHGGLHLFLRKDGETEKRLAGGDGGLEAIAQTIANDNRFPIYVAEGNSQSKQDRIAAVPYLKLCFQRLKGRSGCFFVYGSSVNENDAHIYDALFSSEISRLYFCIYDQAELAALDGRLANYQKANRSKIQYTFVDSKSAGVWG